MSDTPIADMVARLLEAGVAPSVIVDAVRTAEVVCDKSRDLSRFVTGPSMTPAAIRQRKSRETRKQNQLDAKANDVASNGAEPRGKACDMSRDTVTRPDSLHDSDSINETQKGISKKVRKKERGDARARGERMPEGAILTDELREVAIKGGAPVERVEHWWQEFVDYWCAIPGLRGLKSNWVATWRNRVRERVARGDANGGGLNGHGAGGRQSGSDIAFKLADEIRAREAAARSRGSDDLFGRR